MAKRKAPPKERPIYDGKIVMAVNAMGAGIQWDAPPYKLAYSSIARTLLEMPAEKWRKDDPPEWMREFDGVLCDTALKWIERVRERDLLSSILLTDVLNRLMDFVNALGETHRSYFPTPRCKREITTGQGHYFVEFEVPEGAVLRFRHETLNPGFRGIALVERCHLSDKFNWQPDGEGIVPGFEHCGMILGFNIPCDYLKNARFDGDKLVEIEEGMRIPRIGCHLPFGFIVNSRPYHFGINKIGPVTPKLALDEMVKVIQEAARPERASEVAEAPG
jgi:hypothetical protein